MSSEQSKTKKATVPVRQLPAYYYNQLLAFQTSASATKDLDGVLQGLRARREKRKPNAQK